MTDEVAGLALERQSCVLGCCWVGGGKQKAGTEAGKGREFERALRIEGHEQTFPNDTLLAFRDAQFPLHKSCQVGTIAGEAARIANLFGQAGLDSFFSA